MRITVIGGGSYAWVPALVQGFVSNPFFKDSTICLMDIDAQALNDTHRLCEMFNDRERRPLHFITTTNLDQSLAGASYVILAISHGGLDAELEDHRIARRHGFYNLKGSEVGIAGCSRTLRHVPEAVRIARRMEQICPNAMLLNVTNPLTACTRAVNKYTSIRCYGFCHGVINHLRPLLEFIGANGLDDGVEFNVGGVDHCSWFLSLTHQGRDALQTLRSLRLIVKARDNTLNKTVDDVFAGKENLRLRFLIWDMLGYLPAISDEHCVEFMGPIMKGAETRRFFGVTYDRIAERTEAVGSARQHVKDLLAGNGTLPNSRSSEMIDKFIAALNGHDAFVDVMNYPNEGQIPNLPIKSVIESKCRIDASGVRGLHVGELPPIVESIVRPVLIREELYMEAAMEWNSDKLRAALATDPLVNDFRMIDAICSELLDYNKQFVTPENTV